MLKGSASMTTKVKRWMKSKPVVDVIMFGSSKRGKERPQDIDLCIIVKDEHEKECIDLVDSLGIMVDNAGARSHVTFLLSSSFAAGDTLVKTLLQEGFSIKKGKMLADSLGLNSKSLFVYTLQHFSSSKRVKFHYMLKGRRGVEGILKEVTGEFLGTGSIIVPIGKEDILREIFDQWDVRYSVKRMLVG
ncbi:nucleotidyltransferase domain-containing protein [Candidatus Woesearchaeota archaeon]|nr:nucleotidyltransferase domain-containing protein [Candidatus Woesearchaeota archaeon]